MERRNREDVRVKEGCSASVCVWEERYRRRKKRGRKAFDLMAARHKHSLTHDDGRTHIRQHPSLAWLPQTCTHADIHRIWSTYEETCWVLESLSDCRLCWRVFQDTWDEGLDLLLHEWEQNCIQKDDLPRKRRERMKGRGTSYGIIKDQEDLSFVD